ncbi:MAG: hypothetical protein PHQ75_08785, partial [Thermoguttaceae bacterium]|nr:hypothetical protein [Thermoguttaceae bacterium]
MLLGRSKRNCLLRIGAGLLISFAGTVSMVQGQTESNVQAESVGRSGSILTSTDHYLTGLPVVHRQPEKIAQITPPPQRTQVPNAAAIPLGPVEKPQQAVSVASSGQAGTSKLLPNLTSAVPVPPSLESTSIPYVAPNNASIPAETLEAAQERAVSMSRKLQASAFKTDSAREKIAAARGIGLPKVANTTVAMALNEEPVI